MRHSLSSIAFGSALATLLLGVSALPVLAQTVVEEDGSGASSIQRIHAPPPSKGPIAKEPSLQPSRVAAKAKGDEPRAKSAGSGRPEACAGRYHAALKGIADQELKALKAVKTSASATESTRPGFLLFQARSGKRTSLEMAALASAGRLAKAKGRIAGPSDPDSRWIADRLTMDLSDYLGQKETPFLCGGVPQYIETLSRFAERLGASPDRRRALMEAQRVASQRSIDAALAALRPVTPPHFAPADRPVQPAPQPDGDAPPSPAGSIPPGHDPATPMAATDGMVTGGIAGLRPATDMTRAETVRIGRTAAGAAGPAPSPIRTVPSRPATSGAPDKTSAAQAAPIAGDPDLPPLAPSAPMSLETATDRAAAVDRLLAVANLSGFVMEPANQMAIGLNGSFSPVSEPVLARLAEARPYVLGERRRITDTVARLALSTAFADVEALDYLARAAAEPSDPTSTAIHATFDAILKAHAGACDCRP